VSFCEIIDLTKNRKLNKRFLKKGNWVTREIAGETIIVPVRCHTNDLDSIYTLNEIATQIWQLLDGRTNVDHIVEAVCQEYDISPEEARRDTLDFLQSLEAADLITLLDDGKEHSP
jgi:hypothetical protein